MYLLDTNTVIKYLNASLPIPAMNFMHALVDFQPKISVIVKIELLGFEFKLRNEQLSIEEFVNGSLLLGLSDSIIDVTIAIRKTKKCKLPDAIIAATALVHGLILVTQNTKDFTEIANLNIIDPYKL